MNVQGNIFDSISPHLYICLASGALGGDDKEGEDKPAAEQEEDPEIAEARREAEEKRKEKHRKMEEEREEMRQSIRDKVGMEKTFLFLISEEKCIR